MKAQMTPQKLSEIANIACQSFVELIRKREIISFALKDQSLRASYNKTKASHGFLHLTYVLYCDLIAETVSLIADQYDDTASLAQIVTQLEKKSLHDKYRKESVRPHVFNWLNKFDSESDKIEIERDLAKKETRKLGAVFRRNYRNLMNGWQQLRALPEFDKLRRIRNKILSHKATRVENGETRLFELKDFKMKYGECEKLIDAAEPLFVRVGTLVRRTDYNYSSAKQIYAKRAEEFWATCRGIK